MAEIDGSMNVSYLATDYSQSYDPTTSRTDFDGVQAPTASGYTWSFDGTALDPSVTNFGFTKSDVVQTFNSTIWKNTGLARLNTVTTRSYSSDKNGFKPGQGGTYENPFAAMDGSTSQSYRQEDWSASYDDHGLINRDAPPTVTTTSLSFDGLRYSKTLSTTIDNINVWNNLGKTEAGTVTSYTFSSDDTVVGDMGDAGLFGVSATPNYGAGSFDEDVSDPTQPGPVAQFDLSRSVSYSVTDYTKSIDASDDKTIGMPAPVTDGWSWQADGTVPNADGTNLGFTKSDFHITKNAAIWQNWKLERDDITTTRTYTSSEDREGTYDDPYSFTADGSYSRSYQVVDNSNRYTSTGALVRGTGDINDQTGAPVLVMGESLSFDGNNTYTKTLLSQTYNGSLLYYLGRAVVLTSRAISFSSDDSIVGTFDDVWQTADYGGTDTSNTIQFDGLTLAPVSTATGGWSVSDITTDYKDSYDPQTGKLTDIAPTTRGTSLQFDGTPAGKINGITGYTMSQSVQINNGVVWQNTGDSKLADSYSRSWTSDRAAEGSYDNPLNAADGSSSRSYSFTNYENSYFANGLINPDNIPTVTGYSWNFDGFKSYTHTDTTQVNDPYFWQTLGRLVLLSTDARSFSSDDQPAGVEPDAGVFGAAPTTIYGGGTFDDPLTQFDLSSTRSDLSTDYSNSFQKDLGVMGHFSDVAPVSSGWSWNNSGIGDGFVIGISRSNIQETFSNDLWNLNGEMRLVQSVSDSYSSNNDLVGGTVGVDSVYGAGSPTTPFVEDNGTSFIGHSETDYNNSWLPITGQANAQSVPVTNSWTLNYDGFRYEKSVTNETYQADAWGESAKLVAALSTTQSFSSDQNGGGTYYTPVIRADHTYDRSLTTVDYFGSYDQFGRPTDHPPVSQTQQDSGEVWRQSEFESQDDMDAQVALLLTALNGLTDAPPISAQDQQLGAILRQTDSYDPNNQQVDQLKGTLTASLEQWVAGHNIANTSYDDFYDFVISWLGQFPTLDQWQNPANEAVPQAIYASLYRPAESGSDDRFIQYMTDNFSGFFRQRRFRHRARRRAQLRRIFRRRGERDHQRQLKARRRQRRLSAAIEQRVVHVQSKWIGAKLIRRAHRYSNNDQPNFLEPSVARSRQAKRGVSANGYVRRKHGWNRGR